MTMFKYTMQLNGEIRFHYFFKNLFCNLELISANKKMIKEADYIFVHRCCLYSSLYTTIVFKWFTCWNDTKKASLNFDHVITLTFWIILLGKVCSFLSLRIK